MEQEKRTGNWYPENLARIQEALTRLPAAGNHSGSTAPPFAVFDFDNTCIFRDIGQAVFRVQLLELHYRINPQTLATLIPEKAQDLAGRPWELLRSTILQHYQELWPLIQAEKKEEAQAHPAYPGFVTLFYWYVVNARSAPELGPRYVLALLAKIQAGFTLTELQAFCTRVLDEAQQERLAVFTLQAEFPAPLGSMSARYPTGLQPFAEMQELMKLFLHHGLRCYVVSASSEWLVQTVAPRLGFPLTQDNIFGVRTTLANGGLVLPQEETNYPLTYREGKNAIIDRFIGGTPWFVAGDADTDYDMLTRPGVCLRLLINRNLSGLIGKLYQRPDILLQGIDQRNGCFRPSRQSIA